METRIDLVAECYTFDGTDKGYCYYILLHFNDYPIKLFEVQHYIGSFLQVKQWKECLENIFDIVNIEYKYKKRHLLMDIRCIEITPLKNIHEFNELIHLVSCENIDNKIK